MNEKIAELIKLRQIPYEQIKQHGIFWSDEKSRYVIPIRNEYGGDMGYTEYGPGGKLPYVHRVRKTRKPPIYNSEVLPLAFYGMPVFVTEGIFDALSIEQAGHLAVAVFGGHLSFGRYDILKRFTNKIILAYDSDMPGQEAIERDQKKYSKKGVSFLTYRLPGHKDANDFIRSEGVDKLKKLLDTYVSRL